MSAAGEKTSDRDVVIYDGHCRICTSGIKKIRLLDWFSHFRYVSLHDAEVGEKYPDLTYDMMMDEMYVVSRGGARYAGAAGFRYLSWRIPLFWPIAPIMSIPGTSRLWSWLYQLVAKNRYRFGRIQDCEGGTCHLHFGGKPTAAPTVQAKN
jgi:predicted DCC family thiol-disulfide oxidoreductase YuxK